MARRFVVGAIITFTGLLTIVIFYVTPPRSPQLAQEAQELTKGYYTIFSEEFHELVSTSLSLAPGDEFITPDGKLFRVSKVSNRKAYAKLVSRLSQTGLEKEPLELLWSKVGASKITGAIPRGEERKTIVAYHTHSDESYSGDGGPSNARGGGEILVVGRTFVNELRALGFRAFQSKTLHDPHDAAAYSRSRRTAFGLIKHYGPYALFDIHRDAGVPASKYTTKARNESLARVMIVVGRQNPLRVANTITARKLMAVANANYPDLIKGILLAEGNYNQDLDPAALLLEIGTNSNTLEEAKRGAELIARMIALLFGPGRPSTASSR